jgi:NADH dehydrogenase
MAGALAELARHVLKRDFRHIDPTQAKIILLEGSPRVLASFPEDLSQSTARQLEQLGVHLRTSTAVKNIRRGEVELDNGEIIHAENIIWAAGVSASPLTGKLGVELDRAGRVKVNPDLSLPGHSEVFAVGDMAFFLQEDGKPVPGVSPAAMQMAEHVAQIIDDEMKGRAVSRAAFKYWDKGTMATIGRSKAVAVVGKIKLTGLVAWLAWLALHLVFLVGFRNKIIVLIQWMYSYCAYKRGARIITDVPPEPKHKR